MPGSEQHNDSVPRLAGLQKIGADPHVSTVPGRHEVYLRLLVASAHSQGGHVETVAFEDLGGLIVHPEHCGHTAGPERPFIRGDLILGFFHVSGQSLALTVLLRELGYGAEREFSVALQDLGGAEAVSRKLLSARSDDVAILLGFARYSRQILDVAELLKCLGVPMICITDDPSSPLAPFATACFVAPRKAGFVLSGPGAGAMVIIDALLRGTALALGKAAVEERSARLARTLGDAVFASKTL